MPPIRRERLDAAAAVQVLANVLVTLGAVVVDDDAAGDAAIGRREGRTSRSGSAAVRLQTVTAWCVVRIGRWLSIAANTGAGGKAGFAGRSTEWGPY